VSRPWRIALGGLAVLALIWYFSGFERVPVTVRAGMSGEARLRPFLAAERFAERMGLPARELRALPELDRLPERGALLLPRQRRPVDARRASQLVRWVAAGGHLIVEAETLRDADPVFVRFGLRFERDAAPRQPVRVEVTGSARKLALTGLRPGRIVATAGEPVFRAGAEGAERILTIRVGEGLVTAAVDLDFARNHAIGRNDHAELLWRILTLAPAGELAVFHHPQRLSLWGFLLAHAAAALAAAAVLLALWLWRIAPRYGTLLPDPPPVRRRLLDHLRASGRYLWARGLGGTLAAAAREAALRRVARAYPDFAVASGAERSARLVALAGLTPADAAGLLATGESAVPPGGAELIRLVHSAQRVHAALERGNR
jgi:hypothetical protein